MGAPRHCGLHSPRTHFVVLERELSASTRGHGGRAQASMQLEHVYGYAGTNNLAPNIYFLRSGEVVYYTAALGVVFSKEHWRAKQPSQRFFFGHDNDIQCLNVHPNRRFVVSGQQVPPHPRDFTRGMHFVDRCELHISVLRPPASLDTIRTLLRAHKRP